MGMAEGSESGADRTWPTRHGGGYPKGWQVRYRGRREGTALGFASPRARQDRIGTVAGPSLRAEHTGTTWVPVRPFCAVSGTPLKLVRATDIIDARPPGEPVATGAADDEDEDGVVVVEPPDRGSGDDPSR
ncbi:hypothetical protein SAMN04489727_8665 [Amycolatopsis tolypomycina]|uniref:Uncharacterized protein n=1 Tax=Amycolatopsis tolypomycina TaxID=208445 RepID=A0A1H5C9Y0_9PSEU|nr:hypothetical protein [Amycolatopsis tolypomycina]SED63278.1 hypothetical protein SAMN04489727_8665 [Amycolatopsis tolypomycina]